MIARRTRSAQSRVARDSTRRLFVTYVAVSLVPVVLLGVVLMHILSDQGHARGLAEGRTEAGLIARSSIAPQLDGADLRKGLTPTETAGLGKSVDLIVSDGQVLRLRLRDLDGNVIFSDDNTHDGPDDESLEAAAGETVSDITYLNADNDDGGGPLGPRVVEVYEPLLSAQTATRIGVLELYLPYAPIAADIAQGQQTVSVTLSVGLLALWLCLLGVSLSVAGRLRRQARLNAHQAVTDALTGLPNRARFSELIETATTATVPSRQSAVALIDLDRFKEINDTLGHDNGDRVLLALAARLKENVRENDVVARLGGDEFGLVLPNVANAHEAEQLLGRLRKVLAEPVHIDGLPLAVEVTVGYTLTPQDGTGAGLLMQNADVAMYAGKQQHGGVVGYKAEQNQYDATALRLVAELGEAIPAGQLVLHYQPKVNVRSGQITSVEALVRWQHPTRGLLYPDAFLPAVEHTELIEPLTWWVLRTATLALAELDPGGSMHVAVNISARSLIRPDFADDLLAVLAGTGTVSTRVILEVTETMLLTDPPRAAETLRRLHRAGFSISIDDFGAGQTSLGYLAVLPVNELKIDKSFVLTMLSEERNAAIVSSVVDLGHNLGFTVTAEGVETVEVLERLRDFGCDTVQGYLFARPMPLPQLREMIAARPLFTTPTPHTASLREF